MRARANHPVARTRLDGAATPVLHLVVGAGVVVCAALVLDASPALAQAAFTCGAAHYASDDGCDCGCGELDPDCGPPPVDLRRCDFDGCPAGQAPDPADVALCRASVCGDGWRGDDEACDDGDTTDEGGCSADCSNLTPGWVCGEGADGCRRERCGDGLRTMMERCDDGNDVDGDGCSAECIDEPGFICYVGMPCRPTLCGDAYAEFDYATRTGETCDDGNRTDGDGCGADCEAEPGFYCDPWGGGCFPTECGNGAIEGDIYYGLGESCDDQNDVAGDGCDECVAEPGYICWNGPCHQVDCGDGFIDADGVIGFEQCDDGNQAPNDGCDPRCLLEPGFDCYSAPPGEPCIEIVCGDGVQSYDQFGMYEACDDGNAQSGDGCDANCSFIEPGYLCPVAGEPCRLPVCGNGYRDIDPFGTILEQCDDGNENSGDGCTARCQVETGFECIEEGVPCVALPDGWTCSLAFYGAGDGCDCGCGADDPDCSDGGAEDCSFNHCFEEPEVEVDPCDRTRCVSEQDVDDDEACAAPPPPDDLGGLDPVRWRCDAGGEHRGRGDRASWLAFGLLAAVACRRRRSR